MVLQTLQVFVDGAAHRVALYRVLDVNTGDTVDVSADFRKVLGVRAMQVSAANPDCATPQIAETVITFGSPGLSNDAVYLLVVGGAA